MSCLFGGGGGRSAFCFADVSNGLGGALCVSPPLSSGPLGHFMQHISIATPAARRLRLKKPIVSTGRAF
jgi:hypothetical protein